MNYVQYITNRISSYYTLSEARSIAFLVLEHFNISKTDIVLKKDIDIDTLALESILKRLTKNEPIQYILGYAWFYDYKFKVNSNTLIPRSETEELVYLILKILQSRTYKILDIGTGSGCIPISLKLQQPLFKIVGCDISKKALQIARKNAKNLNAKVKFLETNIFDLQDLNDFEVIISNPPYVTYSEKNLMQPNVLDYEPHLALFVEDNNPLVFYKYITQLAQKSASVRYLFFEINEQFGAETKAYMLQNGFNNVHIVKDMQNKNRFIWGTK